MVPEWQQRAACLGMSSNLFFPESGEPTKYAKAVCARCEVREECLEYGLHIRWGMWGGVSELERRRRVA